MIMYLKLQVAADSLADFSTLKMEAIRSSETSVHARCIQRYITEDGILHNHRCKNLKSYMIQDELLKALQRSLSINI
jgi:hypothetical protein